MTNTTWLVKPKIRGASPAGQSGREAARWLAEGLARRSTVDELRTRAATGSDAYELERRLGHQSQRYISRYTNPREGIAARLRRADVMNSVYGW